MLFATLLLEKLQHATTVMRSDTVEYRNSASPVQMLKRLIDVRTKHDSTAAYRLCATMAIDMPLHASHSATLACVQLLGTGCAIAVPLTE